MPSAYPTAAELVAYFALNGYPTLDSDDATGLITTAIGEWTSLCYWEPFLAASAVKTFDVPTAMSNDGFRLLLDDEPFLSVDSIVHTSLSGTEATLVAGTDFDLLPLSSGADLNPYFVIRFRNNLGDGSVEVTADFGFTSTVPQDVYDAILEYAENLKLARLSKASAMSKSGMTATKIKQGPVELTYSDKTASEIISEAKSKLGEVAMRYSG